jgi:regulator of protease activity HflC (stomatin/prohibitin superfamily)
MEELLGTILFSVPVFFIGVPIMLWLARVFCFYVIVVERQAVVFELFGKVRGVITEPGLHSPWAYMGPFAMLVPLFGKRRFVDLRLSQTYLRSQPVNSEEGAPMGIGVWYEMQVSDPLAYVYKNVDPQGSLLANVSNATVRCLSNMKLERMLEDRHSMSRTVRSEVSPQSHDWGYVLGSVYIRKVHFRDPGMVRQIEQKVVNRLRQVTAAIQQDGNNRVSVIHSTAEREAAIEFARAAATRPRIVGEAIARIAKYPEICNALFDLLETQQLVSSEPLAVTFIPKHSQLLGELMAANPRAAR